MPSLSDMQAEFAGAVLRRNSAVPTDLKSPHRRAPERRFNIHRNNVRASLIAVLRDRFPVVERLVGAEFFDAMALAFVEKHPPGSPILMQYGETFSGFIDGFEPVAGLPYLGDVARLEWARAVALDAADAAPLDLEALRRIAPADAEHAGFTLHPSLRIVRSDWPVVSIWSANMIDADTTASADLGAGAEDALVLRPALAVLVQRLPEGGADFIAALGAGRTLGEAAGAGMAASFKFDLQGNLTALLRCGAVVAIITAADTAR